MTGLLNPGTAAQVCYAAQGAATAQAVQHQRAPRSADQFETSNLEDKDGSSIPL
jgi:hypothetical protein